MKLMKLLIHLNLFYYLFSYKLCLLFKISMKRSHGYGTYFSLCNINIL